MTQLPAQKTRRPIVITHDGGLQFSAQVRDHRIVTDQPERAGGNDAGPAPLELLGIALGSCVALYVQQFCHARGIVYDGMRVEVEQHGAQNPNRIGRFDVQVILPALPPPHVLTLLERIAQACPAHASLSHAAEIGVSVRAQITGAPRERDAAPAGTA